MTDETRSRTERLFARIIDFMACKLTPNTLYLPKGNPFAVLGDDNGEKKDKRFLAAYTLIQAADKKEDGTCTVEVEGLKDSAKSYGDWIVTAKPMTKK